MSMSHTPPGDAQAARMPADGLAPAETVLDPHALSNLAQLDPTGANRLVQRVLTTYRSSMARLLAQFSHARAQQDLAALKLVSHTLKSSSASVGAVQLSALCAEAERHLRDGETAGLDALLDQLLLEAQRVDAAVLQLLNESS